MPTCHGLARPRLEQAPVSPRAGRLAMPRRSPVTLSGHVESTRLVPPPAPLAGPPPTVHTPIKPGHVLSVQTPPTSLLLSGLVRPHHAWIIATPRRLAYPRRAAISTSPPTDRLLQPPLAAGRPGPAVPGRLALPLFVIKSQVTPHRLCLPRRIVVTAPPTPGLASSSRLSIAMTGPCRFFPTPHRPAIPRARPGRND